MGVGEGPGGVCDVTCPRGGSRTFRNMSGLLKLDNALKTKVDAFRERVTAEAEDLVASFFPKKLLELDSFLKEPLSNISDLATIHSDLNLPVPEPIILTNSHDGLDNTCNIKKRKLEDGETNCPVTGTKVFIMPNGIMKSNRQLVEMIEKIKPEIRTLMEKCNTVKMWVQLLIPRIEDGNNFGVSIQEETVAELRTVESEAASYLDQISRYYITRAKLVSKVAKYPHVEDYRRTVSEIDEKEYISLRLIVSELRNQYGGRKLEHPEATHIDTGRTNKLLTGGTGFEPGRWCFNSIVIIMVQFLCGIEVPGDALSFIRKKKMDSQTIAHFGNSL